MKWIETWPAWLFFACSGGIFSALNYANGHSVWWVLPAFVFAPSSVVLYLIQECPHNDKGGRSTEHAGGNGR